MLWYSAAELSVAASLTVDAGQTVVIQSSGNDKLIVLVDVRVKIEDMPGYNVNSLVGVPYLGTWGAMSGHYRSWSNPWFRLIIAEWLENIPGFGTGLATVLDTTVQQERVRHYVEGEKLEVHWFNPYGIGCEIKALEVSKISEIQEVDWVQLLQDIKDTLALLSGVV